MKASRGLLTGRPYHRVTQWGPGHFTGDPQLESFVLFCFLAFPLECSYFSVFILVGLSLHFGHHAKGSRGVSVCIVSLTGSCLVRNSTLVLQTSVPECSLSGWGFQIMSLMSSSGVEKCCCLAGARDLGV